VRARRSFSSVSRPRPNGYWVFDRAVDALRAIEPSLPIGSITFEGAAKKAYLRSWRLGEVPAPWALGRLAGARGISVADLWREVLGEEAVRRRRVRPRTASEVVAMFRTVLTELPSTGSLDDTLDAVVRLRPPVCCRRRLNAVAKREQRSIASLLDEARHLGPLPATGPAIADPSAPNASADQEAPRAA
jgi:hypothetical protein